MLKFSKWYFVVSVLLISLNGFSNIYVDNVKGSNKGSYSNLANLYSDSLSYALSVKNQSLIEKYSVIIELLSDSSELNKDLLNKIANGTFNIYSISDFILHKEDAGCIFGQVTKIEVINFSNDACTYVYLYDTISEDYIKIKVAEKFYYLFNDIQSFLYGETIIVSNYVNKKDCIEISKPNQITIL